MATRPDFMLRLLRRMPTRALHRPEQISSLRDISTNMKRDLSVEFPEYGEPEKRMRSKSPDCEAAVSQEKVTHEYPNRQAAKAAKKYRKKIENVEPGTHDDVFWREVRLLLGDEAVDAAVANGSDLESPFHFHEEVELTISRMSSNGEGLAIGPSTKPWVVAVPFSLPNERVRARIYRNVRLYSLADLVGVDEPNTSLRDMERVNCKYFGKCGGCQYQMLSYETQLDLKRDVVVRAYQLFSDLPHESVPTILPTASSPLQYGYRTKITPHFEAPVKGPRRGKKPKPAVEAEIPESVPIGFNMAGKRDVLDIEECPIATPVINRALGPLRQGITEKLHTYKKGASLLLRNSLQSTGDPPTVEEVCVTDHKAQVREKVGDMLFEYPASSFFQNNNSILTSLTDYVREAIFAERSTKVPTFLVDAYCGSGLFSIMLSRHFQKIAGIELSPDSISSATKNARLNDLPEGKITFRAGDAAHIFQAVPDFPAAETAVIIDPPRKGCDEGFIDQLLGFRSAIVVYVSCNVHTQARDVGMILRKSQGHGTLGKYVLESIRGFDLFPQTSHVESVAVLRLVENEV